MLYSPQLAGEQGWDREGDPLHPQGEREEEHEEWRAAGGAMQGAPDPSAHHPALLCQAGYDLEFLRRIFSPQEFKNMDLEHGSHSFCGLNCLKFHSDHLWN